MTRKFTFLLMALLALAGFKSWGQETITVDFESGIPSGWTTIDADGDGLNWEIYNYYANTGSNCLRSESYQYPGAGDIDADNLFVSPLLAIGADAHLSFYTRSYSNSWKDNISVQVSTTLNPSDFQNNVLYSGTPSQTYSNINVDLSAYEGQQVYIAFRHTCSAMYYILIDDITIDLGDLGEQFDITVNQPQAGGTISTSSHAPAGMTVNLSATPDFGYTFGSWTVTQEGGDAVALNDAATVATNSFTMPESNVTVTATFNQATQYAINCATLEGGSIHAEFGGETITQAPEGTVVTLVAVLAPNYALEHFIVNGLPIEGNTFIMPENDVTVSATFVYHPTLTVNDGTATNEYIPVYGNYCDASSQQNQFIIPAEQLAEMLGGTISGMTFYLSSPASGAWGRTWTVKLMETTETTISSLINVSAATPVYTGILSGQSSTMEVPFTTTSYVYNGGNLLVDFSYSGGSGNYKSASFYGVDAPANSSYCHYDYYGINNSPQAFLPKTTFDYTPNPNLHHITVNQPTEGGGTISAPAVAISGDVVTLTATPELGYAFGEWITAPAVEIIDNQFVMPSSDVTITATFSTVTMYAITFTGIDETIISVAAKYNGETITEAQEGIEVTLEHTMLSDEYGFKNWIVNGETLTGNTFTMPAESVEIGVNLAELDTWTVCDGTSTNAGLPIYGIYADTDGTKCQFIIPAAKLEAMTDGVLASMKFYFKELGNPDNLPLATWKGYVKEVDYIDMSSGFDSAEGATTVFIGHVNTCDNGTAMKIDFVEPYTYNGGNLLIGFDLVQKNSSYPSTTFCGEAQDYVSGRYKSNTAKFIPKTTFAFIPDPNRHSVTVNQPVGGTIAASPMAGILPGTSVTLTATPNFGYEFDAWIVKDADEQDVDVTETEGVYTFEMPASDVTVTATFNALQQYDITFVGVDETLIGVAAKYNGETITEVPAGTEVTLEYTLLNEGYTFINWTLNGEPLDVNTFEMPANDVEIGVVLNERPRYAVIIDGSIVNGTVEANPNTDILGGTQVTLTITPDTYYRLASLTVTDGSGDPVTVTNNKFSMPESNATVTATFEYHPTLTVNDGTAVNTNNSTGQVPFNGYNADNYNNKSQFVIPASALEPMIDATITDITFYLNSSSSNKEYTYDNFDIYVKEVAYTTVGYTYPEEFTDMTKVYSGKLTTSNYQLTIHFDTPFVYGGQNLMIGFNQTTHGTWGHTYWLGKEEGTEMRSRSGYGTSIVNSYNFLPKTTFDFTPGEHRYNITTVSDPVAGGTVTTDQTNNKATAGTLVTLTATPEFGYAFGEWTTDPEVEIVDNQFEMPESNITITATFTPVESYAISFNLGEYEGLVDVAAKYNDETITEAPAGTEVTLEYSNLNIGYTFGNWTLNGEALAGNTFTMPATDVEIGVNLSERPRFAVSIDGSITNGTITANPSTNILGNTTVTLTITPAEGYGLGELTVTDGSGNSVTVNNNQFSMPESNVTVTATFVPALTVYDGTETNMKTAVYAFYGDADNSAAQFVIPASQLEAMAGGTISSLKFYVDPSQNSRLEYLEGPTYAGYIMEVEETTMSNFIDFNAATNMFNGHVSLTNSNSELVINFAEPFTYNGGNLAIAFECTESSSYTNLYYFGTTVTGSGIYRNGPASTVTASNFIPKTTFYYTPGEVTYYDINMHVNGNVTVETLRANSTLQAPENIPAGLTFSGWTTTDIETYTDVAPAYQTKVTEVSDLYAVFSYSEMGGATTWTKVTSFSELSNNDVVVIAATNGENTGYTLNESCEFTGSATCLALPATFGNSGATIAALPEGTTQFTVALDPIYSSQFSLVGESGNKLVYWEGNLNVPTGAVPDYTDDLFYFDYGGLIWSGFDDDYNDLYVILHNYDSYGGTNMRFGIDEISAGWTYAAYLYKPQGTLTTYYMTEALTDGTVAESTSTNNIIITGTHSVNVASGARLEMNEGGLFRNENTANFVFADGAQFYYTGEESVNATFEKEITGYSSTEDNYYLIANPTDVDEVAHLTDNSFDIFTFNPGAVLEWDNQHDNAVVEQGTGYLYANSGDVTLQFAGELMPAGETALTLVKAEAGTGLDYPGFNLVGNPFACDAYIGGSFYRMDGTEFVPVTNGPIFPCEGIFVEASENGEELAITTTAASSGANLELAISQSRSAVIDRAIVRFDESSDMHKFMMNPAHTNIRLAKNGQEYAAISSEAEGEIPVSFMAEKDGTYTISVNTENVNAHYIHLIDNLTGMDTDLLSTPSYTFNASTNDYAYRFKLVFNVEIGETNGNDGDNDNFAFMSNGNLVIDNIEGEATLQIVDVLGRVLSTEIVSGSYNKALNLRAGLYILNLNGMTQKIVVE